MTPEHPDELPGNETTDETGEATDQDRIRHLLAAAAQDPTPIPADVAQRLDTVLADLVDERAPSQGQAAPLQPASLAQHRARRWPRGLVAAAVVSVVGLGVANVLEGTGGSADGGAAGGLSESAEDSVQGAARPDNPSAGQPRTQLDSGGQERPQDGRQPRGAAALRPEELPRLRSGFLAADAQRVADSSQVRRFALQEASFAGSCRQVPSPLEGGRGRARRQLVAVSLDGQPATMVLDPVRDGQRLVRVYGCSPVPTQPDGSAGPEAKPSLLGSIRIEP